MSRNKFPKTAIALLVLILLPVLCQARQQEKHRHAKTHGRNKASLRVTYSYEYERFDNTLKIERTNEVDILATYGLLEKLDLIVDIPLKYKLSGGDVIYSWTDDIVLEAKLKLYDHKDFHLAVNPQVSLPTGKYKQGEGEGRATGAIQALVTQDIDPFTFTFSGYYQRNENLVNDRLDIWKVYLIPSAKLTDYLSLNSSIGLERDTNKKNPNILVHLSGGMAWQINEMVSFLPSAEVVFYEMETDVIVYLGTQVKF